MAACCSNVKPISSSSVSLKGRKLRQWVIQGLWMSLKRWVIPSSRMFRRGSSSCYDGENFKLVKEIVNYDEENDKYTGQMKEKLRSWHCKIPLFTYPWVQGMGTQMMKCLVPSSNLVVQWAETFNWEIVVSLGCDEFDEANGASHWR